MTAPGATIASKAEASIRRLRDVEGVSVQTDGGEIREIHVVTSSERAPKQLVRDIQTVLRAGLGVGVDHRVISIARAQPEVETPVAEPEVATAAAVEDVPWPADDAAAEEPAPREERIRFESVNLFVSGPRTQAQVELRWHGLPRIGSASGWSARDEAHRLVAQATAAAVQEFLADPVALSLVGVEVVEMPRGSVAVVSMALVAHRHEKMLTGSCPIEQDTPQAVVLATLAALNRVVGGLRVKEPTEYVLRATTD